MKKNTIKLIGLFVICILLFLFEQLADAKNEIQMISIMVINQDIHVDEQLSRELVRYIEIPKSSYVSSMVQNFDSIENRYAVRTLKKDTIVSNLDFKTSLSYNLKKNQRIITVHSGILESNGWLAGPLDVVDLIMIGLEKQIVLEDVMVLKCFDDLLAESKLPEFCSFVVTEKQALDYYQFLDKSHVYISIK